MQNSTFCDHVDRMYPIELELKDIIDTARSAAYLDINLDNDSEGWLRKMKLYDKRCDL